MDVTFYLHPEFKGPTDTTPADVADQDVRLRTWQWDASESMHLFWAVNRVTPADVQMRNASGGSAVARLNMETQEKDLAVCVPGPHGIVLGVKVPVLVNAVPVKKGDELLWEAAAKPKAMAKASEETWRTEEARRTKEKAAGAPAAKKAKRAFDGHGRLQL